MAWENQLTEKGQFRGVEFYVRSHTEEGGRRNAKNEFPFRDLPAVQDLGRKAHSYNLELYVIGPDYMPARDALRTALDEFGPGELQHPWLGILRVNVDTWRLDESTDRGGIARFSAAFFESGEVSQPAATIDTAAAVEKTAQAVRDESSAILAVSHAPKAMPDWSLSKLQGAVAALSTSLRGDWDAVSNTVGNPVDLAVNIYAQTASMMALAKGGFGLQAQISRVRSLGDLLAGRRDGTLDGDQLARSQTAVGQTIRVGMIAAAATRSAALEHTSQVEARGVRESINALIDDEAERLDVDGSPIPSSLYYALTDLRAAVSRDVEVRGLRLPDIVFWAPATTLPALVIAHRLYGDARRDADIVSRNAIRSPGFVPGGTALEVLSE